MSEPPKYKDILGSLGELREKVLSDFKANGGSRETWSRKDIQAMADAITRAEDFAEIETPKKQALRESLKQARRALENYLEP